MVLQTSNPGSFGATCAPSLTPIGSSPKSSTTAFTRHFAKNSAYKAVLAYTSFLLNGSHHHARTHIAAGSLCEALQVAALSTDGQVSQSFGDAIHLGLTLFMAAVLLCVLRWRFYRLKLEPVRPVKVAGPPAASASPAEHSHILKIDLMSAIIAQMPPVARMKHDCQTTC